MREFGWLMTSTNNTGLSSKKCDSTHHVSPQCMLDSVAKEYHLSATKVSRHLRHHGSVTWAIPQIWLVQQNLPCKGGTALSMSRSRVYFWCLYYIYIDTCWWHRHIWWHICFCHRWRLKKNNNKFDGKISSFSHSNPARNNTYSTQKSKIVQKQTHLVISVSTTSGLSLALYG